MKQFTIVRLAAALMLLWALADNPYAYYQILRWVVCGVTAYSAFLALEAKKDQWAWIFGITAILFNPIAPIHLEREIWSVIDITTAALLLISLKFFKLQAGNNL